MNAKATQDFIAKAKQSLLLMQLQKLLAYWCTVNYCEGCRMHTTNGISFNHESPRRGEIFVTCKITRVVAEIANRL